MSGENKPFDDFLDILPPGGGLHMTAAFALTSLGLVETEDDQSDSYRPQTGSYTERPVPWTEQLGSFWSHDVTQTTKTNTNVKPF